MPDQMSRQLPLVVVLGATACGKSKLAIDLARHFGGEIISADSMQVYRGLDIVTNKVTSEEQMLAKHHLINFLDPLHKFSIVDFRNNSLDIINDLHKRNLLPIVTGGTNYYIESLLWKNFLVNTNPLTKRLQDGEAKHDIEHNLHETIFGLEDEMRQNLHSDLIHNEDDFMDIEKFFKKPIHHSSFREEHCERLWDILEKVDPETSLRYHPKNRRGVTRALQIYQASGKKYSECIKNQNVSDDGKACLGGPLRFKNTCVIWLHCDKELLDTIVNQRVDQMLDRGLLNELIEFHQSYNQQRVNDDEQPNYTTGIFQSIGFKEFHNYLMLSEEDRISEAGQKLLKSSIIDMKQSTRRYVTKQIRWIKSRFLREGLRQVPDLFQLTTAFEEDDWQKQVREPAIKIVKSFIEGVELDPALIKLKAEPEKDLVPFQPGKFYCEPCDRTFIGSNQIESHLQSRKHRNELSKFERKNKGLDW